MDLLLNTVQPYDWGSVTALPRLMGTPPTGEPQAELWMGAHPAAPSRVRRADRTLPLDRVIAADPLAELGAATLRRFGPRLPFLLKLLAADAPLSVQVHPDPAQARAGHAREDALGVPPDAPHRTYRDAHHKPEMIVALTRFRGLCGFRAPRQCADLLDALDVPALRPYAGTLRALPETRALAEVFTAFLRPPVGLVGAVTEAVEAAASRPGPRREELAAYATVARAHPGDPGLLAALMLRLVVLEPGEALFLGPGIPHAYLSGLGVEIMASSDNVLRCGLTAKHVDVAELLTVVRFTATPTSVLTPRGEDGEEVYPAPVDDFRLSRFALRADGPARRLAPGSPQILLCVDGEASVDAASDDAAAGAVRFGPGRSVYVPATAEVALTGAGTVFRATVGRT
ncbi:mannose-6-phosphate isomerase, class I [Streptomyces sp. NPDC012693]|uniref:mannose-6-phosphate isomerase, class I n=1 Tax=unclassified Streptomyces TaxID=2593676 RepID=UPI002030393C|nr:mannose-6-phosphate isomerase, class I [Streptomyces sp. MSC1_001]